MKKYKIYICHYPPLIERKKYLDGVLPLLNTEYEYSTDFTTYNSDNDVFFSNKSEDVDFKNLNSVTNCTDFNFTNALKGLCLEHINIYKKIEKENLDFGIILEDDAIFSENFIEKFNNIITNLPNDNWDVVYLTNGCEGRESLLQSGRGDNPTINNFIKMNIPYSWTAGAYIIKNNTAKLFYNNIKPIVFPPDFELTFLQTKFKSNVYWLETPLIYEGSNPCSGTYYRYNSSVGAGR